MGEDARRVRPRFAVWGWAMGNRYRRAAEQKLKTTFGGLFASILMGIYLLAARSDVAFSLPANFGFEAPDPEERRLEATVWSCDERDLPELEHEIARIIQKRPGSVFAHHLMSHIKMRFFAADPEDLYTLKQASDLAQQAVDLDHYNPVGYVATADVLDLMGSGDRALELLRKAEASGIAPNWRFAFTKARLMASDAQGEKILGLLEKALSMPDVEPRIVVPYVVAILQADFSGEDLIKKLSWWSLQYPSPLFDLSLAVALADAGKVQVAHERYQAILKMDAKNREAQVNDAVLLYRDLRQEKQAIKILSQVLSGGDASRLDPSMKAIVWMHLGSAHLKAQNFSLGQAAYINALKANPKNIATLDLVTKSYREAKAPDKFVRFLRLANLEAPGISAMHALLGETLSESLSQHEDALTAFTDAITLDPERGDYYNGMGLVYYREQNFSQALKLFAAALRIDPKDAVAKYNEACVLALIGRGHEALSSLAEALLLDPKLALTAQGDKDFASLQSIPKFRELVNVSPSNGQDIDLSH